MRYPGKKRLVEECQIVWVYSLQKAFGKKSLIATIREARTFRVPVPGGYFDVWLVDEPHRLPGRIERWSSREEGNARLWLWCLGCQRKMAKLYYYFFPGSTDRSDLLCRECHGLTYLCVNSGGNRWYREVARPLKRLQKEKEKLLAQQRRPSGQDRLAQIENEIQALKQKLKPKTQHRGQSLGYDPPQGQKRPYRNISLFE